VADGRVLVRNIYLSVDPAMRGWVSAVANYSEPVALGAVMRSLAVGRVEESRNPEFDPGDYVTGMFGWQDYAVVDAGAIERTVDGSGLPISTALGVLAINGLTAYFALLDIGQPSAGETVVVSTAGARRSIRRLPRPFPPGRRRCLPSSLRLVAALVPRDAADFGTQSAD
jgi:hypothetical protein